MHWFLKGLRTPHGAVTAVSGPVTTDWKTSTPLDCITVGWASHRLILTRCHFSHVSLFLCWDKNGTAKLRRISHIKHVFRLSGLIPHCDVCYSVNTYENKEKRSNEKLHPNFLFFFLNIFLSLLDRCSENWQESERGTPGLLLTQLRRRCVQTGMNKVFKSVQKKQVWVSISKRVLMKTLRTRFFVGRACLEQICFSTWLISFPQKYFHHSVTFSKNL